jgi:hypothetical protein
VGPLAEFHLPLDRPLGPKAEFKALVRPYLNRAHRPLNVDIYFGNHLLKKYSFYTPAAGPSEFGSLPRCAPKKRTPRSAFAF